MDDALLLDEALWDAIRHPRGRGGKWVEVFGEAPEIRDKLAEREEKLKPKLPAIERRARPVQQTTAFKRGRRRLSYMREFGVHGDEFMYDLATDLGAAGKPQVMGEDELKAHIADGAMELWRGVSDEDYAHLFTGGTLHVGQGFRGNGIYAATGDGGHKFAVAYAQAPPSRGLVAKSDKPVVIHMALHPEANTISYEEAKVESEREFLAAGKADPGDTMRPGTSAEVMREINRSPTRWALAHGYDAVIVHGDGEGEVVILNRRALLVSSEFERAGMNVVHQSRAAA